MPVYGGNEGTILCPLGDVWMTHGCVPSEVSRIVYYTLKVYPFCGMLVQFNHSVVC